MALDTGQLPEQTPSLESAYGNDAFETLALAPGCSLQDGPEGLALVSGNMTVRCDFTRMMRRIAARNLSHELVVRAARVKGASAPKVVDATAGLGEDSLLLAAAGFEVRMLERNPVIAALLQDGLDRAADVPELACAVGRMKLFAQDSLTALPHTAGWADVVLLDPMFPAKQKSSAVKKKLQILQQLEEPCEDEEALLEAAFSAKPRKVVIKRPVKGPNFAGRKPDYTLAGKAIRFDCFAL